MNKAYFILLVLFLLIASACSIHKGVVQTDSASYISFIGDLSDAVVQVDNNPLFSIDTFPKNDPKDGSVKYARKRIYEVTPGTHTIIVTKFNQVVVNRKIYVGNHSTIEISVP